MTAPLAREGSANQSRRLIFSNDLDKLTRILGDENRPLRYLILDRNRRYQHIGSYLAGRQNSKAVDLPEECRRLRADFKAKYIDVLSELNRANHSFAWWGYDFTRKECLYTDFAERIFHCYLIGKVAKRQAHGDIVVVTGDSLLAKQMDRWAAGQGIACVTSLKLGWRLEERLRCFTLGRMGYTLFRALHYWLMVKVLYRVSVSPKDEYVVLGTLFESRSFLTDSGFRDIYFGELPEFMSADGTPVLVYGGILKDAWKTLSMMRKRRLDVLVLPWHYFSTIPGILNAAIRWMIRYLSPVKLNGTPAIEGINLDLVVKAAIQSDLRSGHFFESMWVYHSAQALAKKVKVSSCVIPYENRSWEKMLLAGMASNAPEVRTVGYHHAAVSPAHTNLLLGVGEAKVIPLPDNIIMMGGVTKEILEKSGNYPDRMLETGCALRQGRDKGPPCQRHGDGKVSNILVALASSVDEYVNVLLVLEEAFQGTGGYQIGIRPHPEFAIERALRRLPGLNLDFQLMGGPLEDNIAWANVVVYVSSTVGLNAVSHGVPVVAIDLGEFVDYDPAPASCPMKWSVDRPDQLVKAFQKIEGINDPDYRRLQKQAVEFTSHYFHPVTDESLKAFSMMVTGGRGH